MLSEESSRSIRPLVPHLFRIPLPGEQISSCVRITRPRSLARRLIYCWTTDSATKYFGGHSDALTGTLSVRTKGEWMKLWHNRTYTGATPGGLESWLILRSLRTLNLVSASPLSS
jgi:hypothetical protein